MTQLSQLGFWMFSGALGAVGVAATVGVLDQPPNRPGLANTSLVGEQVAGSKSSKKPDKEKVAKLAVKLKPEPAKKKLVLTPPAIVPSFDLLRVEKDGSTLIAGHAQPDSTIEIFDGVIIVATTEAGSNGDFVAILEKPLSPGDHQLGIRSTGKDNKIQVSAETGLVSVPVDKDGELLAMVMKPGEASRIIQKPATAKPAERVEAAKLAPAAVATKPAETVVEITNVAPESKTEVAIETPVTPESKSSVVAKTEIASAPIYESVVVAESKIEPAAKPVVKDAEQAVIKVEPAKEAASIKEAEATKEQQVATLAPPKKPAEVVELEKAPTIIVEAVEIDGPIMFIAGAAEPGRRIAIYVDNNFVGFAEGSRKGRFLLEVERKLSRGEHLVRADIYDAKGVVVASRAEVPLIHEPEEPAVVVAKVEPKPKPALKKTEEIAEKKAAPAEIKTEVSKVEIAKVDITKEVSASPSEPVVEPAKEVVASTAPSAPIVEKTEKAAEKLAEKAPEKPKKAEEVQVAVATVEEKPVDKPVAIKPETTPVAVEKVEPKKPAESNVVAKAAPAAPPAKEANKPVVEATKTTPVQSPEKSIIAKPVDTIAKIIPAPVQPAPEVKKELIVASATPKTVPIRRVLRTGSSVIIRRGDSLWRISYRTYGRGIRYSTIYQANLSQLRSPHRIYPGQILKVPKKTFKQQG